MAYKNKPGCKVRLIRVSTCAATSLDRWMFSLTFRGHTQVGHDHQHGVGLEPQHVRRHVLVIQRFRREDDACPVVHSEMTFKQTRSGKKKE